MKDTTRLLKEALEADMNDYIRYPINWENVDCDEAAAFAHSDILKDPDTDINTIIYNLVNNCALLTKELSDLRGRRDYLVKIYCGNGQRRSWLKPWEYLTEKEEEEMTLAGLADAEPYTRYNNRADTIIKNDFNGRMKELKVLEAWMEI